MSGMITAVSRSAAHTFSKSTQDSIRLLTGLGVELTPIEEQPWGRFTVLQDLDGNGWILTQLTNPDEVRTR